MIFRGSMASKFLCYLVFVCISLKALAQDYPGARMVSLKQQEMMLEDLFRIIYQQTGMTAFYNDEQLNSYERISVDQQRQPLDNVLAGVLRKRGVAWCYRKDVFVIAYKREGDVDLGYIPGEDKRLVFGRVKSDEDFPLDAVVIMSADHRNGTVSDHTGWFVLRDLEPDATLLVQRMGYKPLVLPSYPDTLNIKMTAIVAPLKEVSVPGKVQGSLTGSVSQVSSKEIAESPVNNVLGALQGRVPGLFLNQTTGLPGGGYRIRLRGKNSIESNSDPLILVDGVPLPSVSFNENFYNTGTTTGANVAPSPLNLISVNDIAGIEILKDADATVLYGTKGANGVILIKSKVPDLQGKPLALSVNYYTGTGKASNLVRYLDTRQYLQMRREAIANDGRLADSLLDYDILQWDTARYKDWQKQMIGGCARISDGSLELKGSSRSFAYRASGNYRRESTVFPSEEFKYSKGGTMLQLWFRSPNGRLSLNLSGSYAADHNRLPITDLTIYSAITPPNAPDVYTDDHKLNFAGGNFLNPYAFMLQVTEVRSNSFRPLMDLAWEPIGGLSLKANIGASATYVKEARRSPAASFNPASGVDYGIAQFSDNRHRNGILDLRGIWKKPIGKQQLSLTVGSRFQFEDQRKRAYYAWGYGATDLVLRDTATATDVMLLDSSQTDVHYQSFYGRLEYKYDDRYFLTLTLNRDGSSRLGREYGNFGAIGAAWAITREQWWKPCKLLSFGKLRGSYGITGNDQFQRDMDKAAWVPGPLFAGIQTGQLSPYPTPLHGWERIRKAEAAIDLGLFQERVSATLCYYNNRSTDQLLAGRFQGFSEGGPSARFLPVNVPAVVENKGLELDLEGILLQTSSLSWNTSLNLSFPQNKLSFFPYLQASSYRSYYSEGYSLDMKKGYHLLGVDPATGIYQFADVGQNGLSFREDGVFTKEEGPFFYGGWYNNIRYRDFELSCLLRYTNQNNDNYQYIPYFYSPGAVGNQPITALDRWQGAGDKASLQRYTTGFNSPAGQAFAKAQSSDWLLTGASYLRLQSLNVAYHFPQKILKRFSLKSCKLYVQGLNLFTITRYNGRDPEVSAGVDSYPSLRIITAGAQISL